MNLKLSSDFFSVYSKLICSSVDVHSEYLCTGSQNGMHFSVLNKLIQSGISFRISVYLVVGK